MIENNRTVPAKIGGAMMNATDLLRADAIWASTTLSHVQRDHKE